MTVRPRRLVLVALLAALAASAPLGAPDQAGAHRPGCSLRTTAPLWHPGRVYAIPHGCAWIVAPAKTRAGAGPVLALRVHGRVGRFPLGGGPLGDAPGFCGVAGFLVSWPYWAVGATQVWLGAAEGCRTLRPIGGQRFALLWLGHFRYTRELGWNPALDFESPPYRRG